MPDRIIVVDETGSTNADLRLAAENGWPEGRWLRAERQSAGKGRMGRAWEGQAGNLFTSTLVELRPSDPPPTGLALLAGVALHGAIGRAAPQVACQLKWPNDAMVGTAKLAGILAERVARGVIIGIGVNVVRAPRLPDRETIALADLPGCDGLTAAALAETLADQFELWLARWRGQGMDSIRPAWLAAAHPVGSPLSINLPDGTRLSGRFQDIGADGALIVDLEDGARHVIHAGDVGLS